MKDNLSIIFAAIILAFLLIILPLFSIVDRQDTMAYNVVLTKTTNFVDEIRSNGFLTLDAYHDYIESLHSTGNTYKVTIQAYNKILIPDEVDSSGNVLSYREEKQLYNTKDIQNFLEGNKQNEEAHNSIMKENAYLFDVNDEIYVSVYNTNLTAGNMMYSIFMNSVEPKSIDITYGGAVKEVNWELYNKLYKTNTNSPEIVLSVPINKNNSINVKKIVDNSNPEEIKCVTKTNDIFSVIYELCKDLERGPHYAYIFDLDKEENRTIKIAVAIKNADLINVRANTYKTITEIRNSSSRNRTTYEQYIRDNYIRLVGMTANIEVDFDIDSNRRNNQAFDIILTNVEMTSTANVSSLASVVVLEGLAKNSMEESSPAKESGKVHLIKDSALLATQITGPYNWHKFLKTGNSEESLLENDTVYVIDDTKGKPQEFFFKIHYRGLKNKTPLEVVNLIRDKITFNAGKNVSFEYYTPQAFYEQYGIQIEIDTIIVKLKTINSLSYSVNTIKIADNWDDEKKMPGAEKAFKREVDSTIPNKPSIVIDGEYNYNTGWYTSDLTISINDNGDTGSGVFRNLLKIQKQNEGQTEEIYNGILEDEYELTNNGEYTLTAESVDYVGYVSKEKDTVTFKIDKTPPKAPIIEVTPELQKNAEWYTSDVIIKIKQQQYADTESGVLKTTTELRGPISFSERKNKSEIEELILTKAGIYTVIAKTYDNAGNVSQTVKQIKIDKDEAPYVSFNILQGTTNQETWNSYVSDHEEFWCLDGFSGSNYANQFCTQPQTEFVGWFSTGIKLRINVHLISEKHKDTSEYRLLRRDSSGNYTVVVESGTFKGTLKDLVIGQDDTGTVDGMYKLEVDTYTIGNKKASEYVYFNIDSHAPNSPTVSITGTRGTDPLKETGAKELDWYVADASGKTVVTIKINREGDQNIATAPTNSGEILSDYKIIKYKYSQGNYILDSNGDYIEDKIYNDGKIRDPEVIQVTEDGAYKLEITTQDAAGNQNIYEEEFKIDGTNPNPAVINTESRSTKGNTEIITVNKSDVVGSWVQVPSGEWTLVTDSNGTINVMKQWYLSDIFIGYAGEKDTASGVAKVEVSDLTISEEINTKVITFTTYDYAGNKSISKAYVGLDKTKPIAPTINMPQTVNPTVPGVYVYNQNQNGNITEGQESETSTSSGYYKTTYVITKNGTSWSETDSTSFELEIGRGEQANFTIEARTYDKAGNYSVSTEVALMSNVKPNAPTILSVNGDNSNSTCSSSTNMMVWIGLEEADKRNTLVISEDSILSDDDIRIAASSPSQYYEKYVGFGSIPVTVYIWQIDMYMNKSDWVTASYHYCYDENYGLEDN